MSTRRGQRVDVLTFELPTKLELVINLKSAKALGVCTENSDTDVAVMKSTEEGM